MDKGRSYGLALDISSLNVVHDNLDSVWTCIDHIVDCYGQDEEIEYDGVIPKEMCDELTDLSDRINGISRKLLELMEQKEKELKLSLGYTPEEIEKMDKFIEGVIGCTVGAMILDKTLSNDNKGDEE